MLHMKHLLYTLSLFLCLSTASADSYNASLRHTFWSKLYPDGGWTLYCNERFSDTKGLNIEHVYPASWMADFIGCGTRTQCRKKSALFNTMESDLHNLWPALSQYNQMRSNYKFTEIPGERWKFSGCDFEIKGKRVEPSPRSRGQIARSMLYMRDTYGLPINDKLMEQWASEYHLTDEEIRRNALIDRL